MQRNFVGPAVLAAIAVLWAAPVFAADMPVKAKPIAPPPVYNWSGFYGGIHGGYAQDPASGTFNPVTYTNIVAPSVTGGGTVLSGPGDISLAVDPQGGFGGIQFGYNWQTGAFVYGLEADVSFGKIKDEDVKSFVVTTLSGDTLDFTGNVRLAQKVDYFGTVRGRVGWAANTLLLYATGGLAWGHVKTTLEVYNLNITNNGALFGSELAAFLAGARDSDSSIRFGYAVGGGLEWSFLPRWSLKGEYLFIDLGNGDTLTIPGGSATSEFQMHSGRIGLNYKFNGPP